MALAKYFSKDLLAINRLINTDHNILTKKLEETVISIAFDENSINTFEGSCGMDLIIRLLSRFYPRLKIIDLAGTHNCEVLAFGEQAKKINSKLEIVDDTVKEDVLIVLGQTEKKNIYAGLKVFLGSDNWLAKYSDRSIQKFGESNNPFGAGLAVCLTVSNVFRYVFREYLPYHDLDSEFELSAYTLKSDSNPADNPAFEEFNIGDLVIAGVGAIGNGVVWSLSKINSLKGNIHLVDEEKVGLSNLQRYILLEEDDEKGVKVEIAKKYLRQNGLEVTPFKHNWDSYLNTTGNWKIKKVAVGIDNIKDRIGIQSTLPETIFNAFTEPELLAITRHKDFINDACLGCSNIPTAKKKDYTNEIADNCKIPGKANLVKDYYNLELPVGVPIPNSNQESLLMTIAKANGTTIEKLSRFHNMRLNEFYSDFVCGGVILEVSNGDNQISNVDAPLAFQSAMAGILLAAEIVKDASSQKLEQEQRTDIYHLSPIVNGQNPFHRLIEKDLTGRCICRDEDFLNGYVTKWEK